MSTKRKWAAIDFESYFDTKCSLRRLSNYQYINHEDYEAYMVSVYCPKFEYCGQVPDMAWEKLKGYTLFAHNASFDQRVFEHEVELGNIPKGLDVKWVCTADMGVYFQYQRNLKGVVKELLDIEVSKEVRDSLQGKRWDDLVADGTLGEALDYAMNDSKFCYDVAVELYDKWPEHERKLSEINREMGWEGLPTNLNYLEVEDEAIQKRLAEAHLKLTWYNQIDPDTRKPYAVYSKKALALECRKRGIPVPASLDKNDKSFIAWNEEYGEQMPAAAAMQDVQRINKHAKTLMAIMDRCMENDRINYSTKYFGATATGRFSGDGGFNVQNLPRQTKYGLNLRSCIRAGEGKTLIVVDLAQIEARVTPWLVGDTGTIDLINEGISPYEAHARLTMGWEGGPLKSEDPELYMLAKVRVLQLGYGSGWAKFAETVKLYGQQTILDRDYSIEDQARFKKFAGTYQPGKACMYPDLSAYDRRQWINAYIQVDDFRQKNPRITESWKKHDVSFKKVANDGGDYFINLPSGREIKYFRCRHEADGTTAATEKGSVRRSYFYGAQLFQNAVQATARDLFALILVRLYEAGFKVIMHVHDEVVIEHDEEYAKEALADILSIMAIRPEWAKDLPIESEGIVTKEYTK
jgi:DNA polymerase I-like protein with 3'-5' exonuclease and polymerase domains